MNDVNNNCDVLDFDPALYPAMSKPEELQEDWLCPLCLDSVGEHFMNPCTNINCSSLTPEKLSYNINELNLTQEIENAV